MKVSLKSYFFVVTWPKTVADTHLRAKAWKVWFWSSVLSSWPRKAEMEQFLFLVSLDCVQTCAMSVSTQSQRGMVLQVWEAALLTLRVLVGYMFTACQYPLVPLLWVPSSSIIIQLLRIQSRARIKNVGLSLSPLLFSFCLEFDESQLLFRFWAAFTCPY